MHRTIICVVTCHMVFGVVSQAKNSEMPDPVGGGVRGPPPIWADQLTLSKLGGVFYAQLPTYTCPLDFKNFRQPWNSSPAYNETAETAVQDNCFYFFYAPTKVSFVFLNELLKRIYLKERQVLNCRNSFAFFLPRIYQACFLGC